MKQVITVGKGKGGGHIFQSFLLRNKRTLPWLALRLCAISWWIAKTRKCTAKNVCMKFV